MINYNKMSIVYQIIILWSISFSFLSFYNKLSAGYTHKQNFSFIILTKINFQDAILQLYCFLTILLNLLLISNVIIVISIFPFSNKNARNTSFYTCYTLFQRLFYCLKKIYSIFKGCCQSVNLQSAFIRNPCWNFYLLFT